MLLCEAVVDEYGRQRREAGRQMGDMVVLILQLRSFSIREKKNGYFIELVHRARGIKKNSFDS